MQEDSAMLQFNIYGKRNIINDVMQSEINATNERTKGYTSLRSITNLKKQSCHKGGFGINNWLYMLARRTIDYVVFPSLYLGVSESHIA